MLLNESNIQVCQEALYLLRQDIALPTPATAAADTSVEWKKCQRAFDNARRELLAEHDWLFATALTTFTNGTHASTANSAALFSGVFAYIFDLPANVTRIIDIMDAKGKRLSWKRIGVKIYTESPEVNALVITDVEDTAQWTSEARNALVYLIARELAIPIAGREGDLKNWHQLYQTKLLAARVSDLNSSGTGDKVEKDVLSIICDEFNVESPKLPRSLRMYTERIRDMRDSARIQVLTMHRWNFAKMHAPVISTTNPDLTPPYCYFAQLPASAIHLDCVYGYHGRSVEWKLEGKLIVAKEPFNAIAYTRDRPDVTSWPPVLYRTFLFRIAADVARVIGTDKNDIKIMEEKFASTLEEAKLLDAREANTPSDAWGRNYYADCMRGLTTPGSNSNTPAYHGHVHY